MFGSRGLPRAAAGLVIIGLAGALGTALWSWQGARPRQGTGEERPLEGLKVFGTVPDFSLVERSGKRIILAEAYPSLLQPKRLARLPKDAGQVVAMVEFFAQRDRDGTLAALLMGDPALDAAERRAVEREEAWILGVTGVTKRFVHRRRRGGNRGR